MIRDLDIDTHQMRYIASQFDQAGERIANDDDLILPPTAQHHTGASGAVREATGDLEHWAEKALQSLHALNRDADSLAGKMRDAARTFDNAETQSTPGATR